MTNRETYVYLDLGGKISIEHLKDNSIFIRVANLHKGNPLVQVNDVLFTGTYSHSIGTNLFFEETEAVKANSPCVKEYAVSLKPVIKQTKTLLCKPVKIAPKKAVIPNTLKNFEYDWSYDYNDLLKRFEDGTLTLQDIVKDSTNDRDVKSIKENVSSEKEQVMDIEIETEKNIDQKKTEAESNTDSLNEMQMDDSENDDKDIKELKSEYESLVKLAKTPVKRISPPEKCSDCDPIYIKEYEYKNIECKVLHATYQPNLKSKIIGGEELLNYIDIEGCILCGFLPPTTESLSTLTQSELSNIFSLENFNNLALEARYYVIQKYVEQLEQSVKNTSEEQLTLQDEFGRTPIDTLDIYKKLCKALKSRIAEINLANETDNVENQKT